MRSVSAACLPAVCACRALSHGLMVMPGVMTLTEAFLGIKHGARLLKLFPSSVRSSLNHDPPPPPSSPHSPPSPPDLPQAISPDTMKSMRAVLPKHVPLIVSGRGTSVRLLAADAHMRLADVASLG